MPYKKISQLIDIILKPFLKHIKSFIRNSLDFFFKCPRVVDEDTEIVPFDASSLYRSIPHEFSFEALDYFLTTYQEDLRPRFKKEFVLESDNFILKTTC